YCLGIMYSEGHGVTLNYAEGLNWLRLSAKQGNVFAQGKLGEMYALGRGVPQNYVRAHMWFNVSKAQGAGTTALHVRMEAEMTLTQMAEAHEMARQCAVSNYKQCGEPEIAHASVPIRRGAPGNNPLTISVPMQIEGGVYVVPVLINNAITLNFVVDSG